MMVLPEWNIVLSPEPEAAARVRELEGLAVADVDASGTIRSVNRCGTGVWGWKPGEAVPSDVLGALRKRESVVLPVEVEGLSLLGASMPRNTGWRLVGYRPKPVLFSGPTSTFRTLIEKIPVPLLRMRADGTVLYANVEACRLTGRSGNEMSGLPLWRVVTEPEDREALAEALEQAAAGRVAAAHLQVRTMRRVLRPVYVHLFPVRQDRDLEIETVLLDVEESASARWERASARDARPPEVEAPARPDRCEVARSALRKAGQAATDEAAFLSAAARIFGEAAGADRATILMLLEEEARSSVLADWVRDEALPPARLQVDAREARTLYLPGDSLPGVHIQIAATLPGHHRLFDTTDADEAIWLPFSVGGRLAGFVVLEHVGAPPVAWTQTDVGSHEALTRLFEEVWTWVQMAGRYRLALATISDCLFSFAFAPDGTRHYHFITRQIEALTGRLPECFLGADGSREEAVQWMHHLVHEEDLTEVQAHNQALRDGFNSELTYRIHHRDGSVRWLHEKGIARRDVSGRMTVSGQLTDVTDDHAVQAVLYDVRRNTEAADQLKSVFIATMSHEIRTPLGAVSGYAELLDRELSEYEATTGTPLPPQVREFIGAIRDKSGQLLHIVNELFDLSNMSGFSRASLPLHPSLLRVTDKIAVLLARKGVHLHLRLASDELFVLADRERLEQILDHLLSNAAKFTERGAVTLSTRLEGREVVVELVDTGIGMSQAFMDRLFTPFTQEDNRLNRRFAGAGLGLALVKRLLDLMGGRVEVESEKGKGSTFRLILPAPLS